MSRHDDPRFQDECADEDALRSGVRARNLRDIRNLYGTEEGPGREMLMEVVAKPVSRQTGAIAGACRAMFTAA